MSSLAPSTEAEGSVSLDRPAGGLSRTRYAAVGCVAGAVIALQITVMRIFSEGSWAHFGSLVVSLAMLGFGLTGAVMSVARGWFDRHATGVIATSLALFTPLIIGANLVAQQIPFNPIFIVSDPLQKWRLVGNLSLYLLPFLAGSFFLGTVLLKAKAIFGRVYFADLAGSGLCGFLTLGALFLLSTPSMLLVPVALGGLGGVLWCLGGSSRGGAVGMAALAVASGAAQFVVPAVFHVPVLFVSEYKGVSYARAFPDNRREYNANSPFGHLEVYASSYLHFAPGLSDNASLNLVAMPENAYLGLYVDGDGPTGIMREVTGPETAYFKYLPMVYPYLVTKAPRTFVVQFGGGISTMVALHSGASSVTIGEANPALLHAFEIDGPLKTFTSDILGRVTVIPYEGRLYLAHTAERYDVIDLSLADSAGLSNPGGFAIVEKYPYTREAMAHYMHALTPNGVLSVTLWNKEEPPKSVLKLYATMAEAARAEGDTDISSHFFVASSYLSTATVLYKRDGFSAGDVATLRKHTARMSFDEIYSKGFTIDVAKEAHVFDDYRQGIFGTGDAAPSSDPTLTPASTDPASPVMPATRVGQLAWQYLVKNDWSTFEDRYLFDVRPLTNARPYFAAYVHPRDLPKTTDRLELFQDEWGDLLLWVTLALAAVAGALVIAIPLAADWHTAFSRYPGKLRTILYFACLGFGYITVEVGLIAVFAQALANATVSASVLITGMLVSSGLGSLAADRLGARAPGQLPKIAAAIGLLLILYSVAIGGVMDHIGGLPYLVRLVCCLLLIAPPGFLMGFPMATGMGVLTSLRKEGMFLWAWGVNGCFSVIGAALVPILATAFGQTAVIASAGVAYLVVIPAFRGVLSPPRTA